MAEVDSAFIQPLEHRPKTDDTIEAQIIPVIDLSGPDDALSGLVAQIGDACRDWGFFKVINHGVPVKCCENIESAARKFFALPKEEKRKVIRDTENPLGYYDSGHTKNVRDWKEVFDFAVENPVITPTLHDLRASTTHTLYLQNFLHFFILEKFFAPTHPPFLPPFWRIVFHRPYLED